MRIVIIGLGVTGQQLLRILVSEGHELRVAESDPKLFERVVGRWDVAGVCGNGAALSTLRALEVDRADLVIAVTSRDETNLLAALSAQQLGAREVIARVVGQDYFEEAGGITHGVLGIDMMINPQQLAGMEVHKLVRSFGALDVSNFAENRVEMLELLVERATRHLGRPLRDVPVPPGTLVAAVVREGKLLIPNGDDVVLLGDKIHLLGDLEVLPRAERLFGLRIEDAARKLLIIGGGSVGYAVARALEADGLRPVIIEQDPARCSWLADRLSRSVVLQGDGTDLDLLRSEDVGRADALLALTGADEVNLVTSLLAKAEGAGRSLALIHREGYGPTAQLAGLDVAVSPRIVAAEAILTHVREEQVASVAVLENGQGEVLEFLLDRHCRALGRPLMYVDFPRGALVAVVVRGDRVFSPRGTDQLQEGDRVLVATSRAARGAVERTLGGARS